MIDTLEIEKTWRDDLAGSPIYKLKNGMLQTYIVVEGKIKDDGKKRLTSKKRDKLYPKMSKIINEVRSGKIVVRKDVSEKNVTILAVINKLSEKIFLDMTNSNDKKQSKIIERIKLLDKIKEILMSHKELRTIPVNMWTMNNCEMFREQISMFSDKVTPSVLLKYFTELEKIIAYAMIKYGVEKNFVTEYRQNKEIVSQGYFRVSRRERKLMLKELMSEWTIEKMASFFKDGISYSKNMIWYMMLYVLANTGVRRSELFAFRFIDFIYSHNGQSYMIVGGQVDRNGIRTNLTKTESSDYRQIPIGMGLAKKLDEYIKLMKHNPMINNPEGIMFPMLNGFFIGEKTKVGEAKYYKACTGRNRLDELMTNEFDLPKGIAYHFFRSWIATQWAKHGIYTEFDIAKYLGHTDMNTTKDSYIHVNNGVTEDINISDFKENLLF